MRSRNAVCIADRQRRSLVTQSGEAASGQRLGYYRFKEVSDVNRLSLAVFAGFVAVSCASRSATPATDLWST